MRILGSICIFITLFSCTGLALANTSEQIAIVVQVDSMRPVADVRTFDDIDDEEEEDFSPAIFFVVLFFFGIVIFLIGAGIVLFIAGLIMLSIFISAGIVSASVIIGLYQRSFVAGFKAFILTMCTAGGIFSGAAATVVLNKIHHWWPLQMAVITGACCGLLAGLLFGMAAVYILQHLTKYFRKQLSK